MPSTADITNGSPEARRRRTIQEELATMGEIHSLEEFLSQYQETERRMGRSEIVSDLITWKIDQERVYRFENCSSTYSLLGGHRYPGLPSEKSSIHGALKRGAALVELTGPEYQDHILRYLAELGPTQGRGSFDAQGTPLGFTLDDFVLHRTKLPLLYGLVKSGEDPEEPKWGFFFDSGFAEYKAYVLGKLKKNPGGSFKNESSTRPAHRPGGSSPAATKDKGISSLDPFDGVWPPQMDKDFSLPEPRSAKPRIVKMPRLDLVNMPVGTMPPMPWLSPAMREVRNQSGEVKSVLWGPESP